MIVQKDAKVSLDRMVNPPKGTLSPRKMLYAAIDRVELSTLIR